ncbi:hypothetical protein RchiOBHm_Chr2g0145511 [Rosa chinensis]|uniref:Uncharacterized protein n=1 Tax=Rosa chinensis TaxID=74649 RepID=A0A2P6RYM3_ROSCH|nr:hypothetical protein RchiOBHm_Chr2g0145511 [Rosa chinensis]
MVLLFIHLLEVPACVPSPVEDSEQLRKTFEGTKAWATSDCGDMHINFHSEEREGDGLSRGIEMDDDVEEEYHGHGAQEMEIIRNSITQSLMSVRNNVNI